MTCVCGLCAISVFRVRFLCFVWDFCVPCKISVSMWDSCIPYEIAVFYVRFMCLMWDFCVPCEIFCGPCSTSYLCVSYEISVFHVGLFSLFFESQKMDRPFFEFQKMDRPFFEFQKMDQNNNKNENHRGTPMMKIIV